MSTKRWIVREQDTQRVASLARVLGVSNTVAALLLARGCDDVAFASVFLNPTHDQLHDPYLMKGMRDAVPRLLRAIDEQELVLVYGDYDLDGTTGTAVLARALKMPGERAGCH